MWQRWCFRSLYVPCFSICHVTCERARVVQSPPPWQSGLPAKKIAASRYPLLLGVMVNARDVMFNRFMRGRTLPRWFLGSEPSLTDLDHQGRPRRSSQGRSSKNPPQRIQSQSSAVCFYSGILSRQSLCVYAMILCIGSQILVQLFRQTQMSQSEPKEIVHLY